MQCYFLRNGHLAGVEMLPPGSSDGDAIARAHVLSSKRKGPLDGFEIWDGGRAVLRHPDTYAETIVLISRAYQCQSGLSPA
jgi:hypothetical protein